MKAVILAGGLGTRLRPLTDYAPKALLPVNKKPIIELLLKRLHSAGISDFEVILGPMGDKIVSYLEGSDYNLSFKRQDEPLGTAHALQFVEKPEDDFLVAAADSLFSRDFYARLISTHEKGEVTVALKRMGSSEIRSSSTVSLEEDRITRIIEKPSEDEILTNYACAPLYVFSFSVFDYFFNVSLTEREEYEIPSAIQNMINNKVTVKGVLAEDFIHLSTIEDFLRLNFPYLFQR